MSTLLISQCIVAGMLYGGAIAADYDVEYIRRCEDVRLMIDRDAHKLYIRTDTYAITIPLPLTPGWTAWHHVIGSHTASVAGLSFPVTHRHAQTAHR